MSWSCVPFSIRKPLDMTAIMSEFWMVDRRWAITMQVRPSLALSRASCTVCHGAQKRTHTKAISSPAERPHKPHNYSNFTIMLWLLSLECFSGSACCRGLFVLSMVQPFELEKLPHRPTDHIHLKEALLEGWYELWAACDNNRDDEW